jgi:hypothetical protein
MAGQSGQPVRLDLVMGPLLAAIGTSVEVWAGADRLRMVNQLCRAWDEVLVMRVFRIVVIRGPSGSLQASMLRALMSTVHTIRSTGWNKSGPRVAM